MPNKNKGIVAVAIPRHVAYRMRMARKTRFGDIGDEGARPDGSDMPQLRQPSQDQDGDRSVPSYFSRWGI
ncbi:hypothetical protein VPNG_00515 [Cytospora leucostoma]|uniref:Uncharacterized protein n=1 Tax=Cytospora leucostoma TaxID=1230097 RepID=A0A423XPB8_9PEZI|nr:hypothetical protein VPNG_00515 [Cytospora leucostoma]